MRKVLVVIAILAAAAACGDSVASNTGAQRSTLNAPAQGASAPGKAMAPGGTTDSNSVPALQTQVPDQGPRVIRQAQLTVSVTSGSFDSKLAAVRMLVEQEQGFISGTDAQATNPADDRIRSGVVTFMVPASKFDETIDALSALGKVQNEHISGQDVSAQYVDLQARLANAQAQRQAMLALLSRAQSISDIIAVQTQLGQITQQIEELEGQIHYLDTNTGYSTVSVQIVEAGAPVAVQPTDSWGFVSALSDAAHNFVTTINYMITGLGALGPVLILFAVGFAVWRRRGSPWPRHA